MKKTAFAFLFLLSCCLRLAAQCPTNITFSTQGQVDSFPKNYPNCTEILGDVVIAGSGIVRLDSLFSLKKIGGQLQIEQTGLVSLNGLNQLDSVSGCLRVLGNPVLTALDGLEKLQRVGSCWIGSGHAPHSTFGLLISDNPQLTSLKGLKNLTRAGCLGIWRNPKLLSLSGLDALAAVGGGDLGSSAFSVYYSVWIDENAALPSLKGLGQLSQIESNVLIYSNPALKSLEGLEQVQAIGGKLDIGSNDSLQNLNGLENLQSLGGCLGIGSNRSLETLAALKNLRSLGGCWAIHANFGRFLVIYNNPVLASLNGLDSLVIPVHSSYFINISNCSMLSTCGVHSICQYLQAGGKADFDSNAPGCNSIAEIQAACPPVPSSEVFSEKTTLQLSPNPTGDFLTLEFSGELAVQVFDPAGKLVLEKRLAAGQRLDLQGLTPGIYLLRAEADERVFAGRFVKI